MYQVIDATIVRAAQLPCTVDSVGWPDLSGDTDEHVAQWRAWLQQVWNIEQFATAVQAASPGLARHVDTVCQQPHRSARDVRRAVVSVVRYLVRATGRATPFGLFAGVAGARFDHGTTVRWGQQHQPVARIDAEWFDAVLAQLEADSELRSRLSVVAHSAATVRDGRRVLSWQRPPDAATGAGLGDVSVRNTRLVQAIMRTAATPIRLREAVATVAAEVTAAASAVEPIVGALVQQGLLITQLRPPMTEPDPLAHLVAVLDAVQADSVLGVAGLVEHLRALHREMARLNSADPQQVRERRSTLSRAVRQLAPSEHPLGLDLRLDCDLALPQAVAREAEAAAAALVRLSPQPLGRPEWQQYRSRFIERYGPHAVVPVTELVADTGLGFPAGYRDTRWSAPAERPFSQRDATVMAWAQRAAWQHRREIVLDDAAIAELDIASGDEVAVQPHTELRLRVQAASRAALDRGDFELAVAGAARNAGATSGRFLDLLDSEQQRRMCAAYAELPTVCDTGLPVQISAPALYSRTNNVARSRQVLPTVLSLGEHPDPAVETVTLEDLAVTADADRLVLLSLSRQRPVEPVVSNAVEMVRHAHPLVRFLAELSTAHVAPCAPFSWGHAGQLPFLPRVRYGRTILAPARWRLETTDLPDAATSWHAWRENFQQWRENSAVPDTVDVGDSDRRMRLHLHTEAHLHLLRTELHRTGSLALREASSEEAFGWIDGHAHEVAIPLAATTPPSTAPTCSAQPTDREHGHLPGSEWVYIKLYGHPDRHNALLTGHLPELLSTWNSPPEWWFLRYHDPDPHLRLRIRLHDAEQAARAAVEISAWVRRLREHGIVARAQFDTYYPETGRFGTGAAMTAAESVFAADSRAVLAQLRTAEHHDGPPEQAMTAASMVQLVCAFHDTPADGMQWLIEHAHTPSGPAPERTLRETALRLADPHDNWAAVHALPTGDALTSAWHERRTALTTYRSSVEDSHRDPGHVLADLLHLHHVRMSGIGPESERTCLRLARATALSWRARTPGAHS